MKDFSEVVNKEFLEKYGNEIRPEYGVVGEGGLVDFARLRSIFDMLEGEINPNRFIYALIHGHRSLMSTWDTPEEFKGKEEEVYGRCLDEGKEWKEIVGYKAPDKGVLL